MIPSDKLRALLADHPPQAYMSKDQEKIRDVWDAAREMLAEREPTPEVYLLWDNDGDVVEASLDREWLEAKALSMEWDSYREAKERADRLNAAKTLEQRAADGWILEPGSMFAAGPRVVHSPDETEYRRFWVAPVNLSQHGRHPSP